MRHWWLLIGVALLAGCQSLQEDSVLSRPAQWLDRTGEALRNLGGAERDDAYDSEVQRLFGQPYIDPLTRYLEQYRNDESRAAHLQQVLQERDQRCRQIAERYRSKPLTVQTLKQYRAGYSYSCPAQVENFARRVEQAQPTTTKISASVSAPQQQPEPQPPAASLQMAGDSSTLAAVSAWSPALVQQLNDCYLLTTIHNYSEASQVCEAPARQGDTRAQLNMALSLRALERYEAAFTWAERAAPTSAEASYLLGQLYEQGQGVGADDSRALQGYLQAAQQGQADAQYRLGVFLAEGRALTADPVAAQSWYQRAAAQGQAQAQLALGRLLRQQNAGEEVSRSWVLRAARQGLGEAQLQLGQWAADGQPAQALVWYELAAQSGEAQGAELAAGLRAGLTPEQVQTARIEVRQALEGGR